jgi:hypothetical protein
VTDFTLPPEGMFTDQRDFVELRLVLGVMHPESADGVRVVAWDGNKLRHMTGEAARKWAAEIEPLLELRDATEAIRQLADEADQRNSAAKYGAMSRSAARKAMARLTEASAVAGNA